jgi:hypothetical protein
MAKNKITKDEFDKWARDQWIMYASETFIKKDGLRILLRFWISLDFEYKVTLGLDEIYRGRDFQNAAAIYNNTWV